MLGKYQNFFRTKFCLFLFSLLSFVCPSISGAVTLEVQYPTISGQAITSATQLPEFAKYLFNLGMFAGFAVVFVSLAIAGAMYLISPAKPDLVANAKDRVSGAISGLLILVLTYLIITTINPSLSIFYTTTLPQGTLLPATPQGLGVSLYTGQNCSTKYMVDSDGNPLTPLRTTSILDLGYLKNQINSVDFTQISGNGYVAILYENPNFWGKCEYIKPSSACVNLTKPFASSASIHPFDFNPQGGGVYFYRKPCFNKITNQSANTDATSLISYCNQQNITGGYYQVQNSAIGNIYFGKLDSLQFQNVPTLEQDCTKYDTSGKCVARKPPSLGGENISSVIIDGDYIVIFVYVNKNITDVNNALLDSCQEFPTTSDVNRLGPWQMKWENIRNYNGLIPNYVIIIPVKD